MKLFLIILALCFTVFAQSEAEQQGREIFEKYQSAIGGKENLAKIRTIEIIADTELSTGKSRSIEIEDRVNNKKYINSEFNNRRMEMISNGKKQWIRQNGRASDLNIAEPGEVKIYRKLPNEKIDGKDYVVVEEIRENSNDNAKTYYDPETFLLFRQERRAGFGGNSFKIITVYKDYRKVDDILTPFSVTTNFGSQQTVRKILRVRYNIDLDPKIFEKDGISLEIPKEIIQSEKNEQIVLKTDKNTIYKDEDGRVISQAEFREKQLGKNYLTEGEFINGAIGLKLKKGNPETAIGAIPPDFTSVTLDNSPIQLARLRGKVIVLNFWSITCGPCIKEMPELNKLVRKYQGKDVEFIAISYDTKDQLKEFFKTHQFTYKQIADAQNIVDLYKATAYPMNLILDKNGKILFSQISYNNKMNEQMIKIIDAALS